MQLHNARHEIFCQRVAAGMSASRAYVAAGYTAKISAAEACASRLLRNEKVRARIGELLAGSAKSEPIDKERLTTMLLEDRALAHSKGQAAAALAITVQLGKLHGFKFDGTDVETAQSGHRQSKPIDFKAMSATLSEIKQLR